MVALEAGCGQAGRGCVRGWEEESLAGVSGGVVTSERGHWLRWRLEGGQP